MPAYRSDAEGEIREAVVAHLRQIRPDARIIHEINVAGQGSGRIDVLAVSPADIVAVEIKSSKDKLDRLPKQFEAMRAVAHVAIAAIHEKFLIEKTTNKSAAQYEREGVFYRCDVPDVIPYGCAWVFPKVRREVAKYYDRQERWEAKPAAYGIALPHGALNMLWREELFALCGSLRVPVGRRATMLDMTTALRWHCNGKELTQGVCDALRKRVCCEADPVKEVAA